jgi:hypothetical protein
MLLDLFKEINVPSETAMKKLKVTVHIAVNMEKFGLKIEPKKIENST